ncbi:hypothetical protein ACJX0J_024210, partial [Zea mays]
NRIEAHSVNEISWLLVLLGAQHDGIPFMLLGRKTLVDDYEYIMLGKLFKVSKDSTKDDYLCTDIQRRRSAMFVEWSLNMDMKIGKLLEIALDVVLPVQQACSWIRGCFFLIIK